MGMVTILTVVSLALYMLNIYYATYYIYDAPIHNGDQQFKRMIFFGHNYVPHLNVGSVFLACMFRTFLFMSSKWEIFHEKNGRKHSNSISFTLQGFFLFCVDLLTRLAQAGYSTTLFERKERVLKEEMQIQ